MGLFSFPGKNQPDAADDPDMPVKPRRSRRSQMQDDEPLDPMLPEKQRARRRLIGATALVLAAIIGLPMIFDADPNKPLSDDVETQIPDKLAPLPDSATISSAPQAAPKISDPVATPKNTDTTPAESSAPETPAKSKATSAVGDPSGSEKTAEKTAEKKVATGDNKSQDKPRKFVLQIAAVNSKSKAEELQNRLSQSGIKSYSQKITTKDGDRFRVRVGPFADREEAEKMHERVKKAGFKGSVQSL